MIIINYVIPIFCITSVVATYQVATRMYISRRDPKCAEIKKSNGKLCVIWIYISFFFFIT